jgi:hypothetical protein
MLHHAPTRRNATVTALRGARPAAPRGHTHARTHAHTPSGLRRAGPRTPSGGVHLQSQNLKRATIIGETTGGGANPGGGNRLSEHFGVFIPAGRALGPLTKTNREGTGVEPDVKVAADEALKVAQVMTLKKAVEKTTDDELKGELQRRIEKLQKETGPPQAKN